MISKINTAGFWKYILNEENLLNEEKNTQ